jgi:putative transposase
MNRAGARRLAFNTDDHRVLFLKLLGEISVDHGVEVHAYCLMGNHFHLLLRTPDSNISEFMQALLSRYTVKFNKLEKLDGALFRSRFKSTIIADEAYLSEVFRYIHLNPVKAKLVKSPAQFHWSSYRAYLKSAPVPSWMHQAFFLHRFNTISRLRNFVESGRVAKLYEYYKSSHVPSIMGTKQQRNAIARKGQTNGLQNKICGEEEIRATVRSIALRNGYSLESIYTSQRGVKNLDRDLVISKLRKTHEMRVTDIAVHFGLKPTSVTTVLSNIKRR